MGNQSILLVVLLTFQLITTSLSQSQLADRDLPALIKIREQFGNPDAFAGWRPDTACFSWSPAYCNEHGRVAKLFLWNLNITSTLPPAIGELDQLETLSIINMPGLHGPIPDSFGNLTHLSIFNIMVTSVSGSLPASLSRTNLTSVSFFRNKLSGTIPRSLQKLPYLTFFNAAYNDLVGPIPPRLVHGGTPDRPLGLMLDNNRLSGNIPWTYAFERHMMQFSVANNRLTGDASFLFGRHKTVTGTIDLSGNKLRFNLTGVEMPMQLSFLNLSHNRIYGGVPASLRESKVSVLDLSYNDLCGEIPTGGHMVQFKAQAYEHNKCLCGTPLPPCASGR
ncbi:polygalacturonase inhibitor-like [Phragmites australis]|uniref:polygalacturonase inhibitor-like n=1 Tax=Phragmites australis TaxID=29695 RepID=UPI002D7783C1|nr:polygalacturonase inhibitor-like [Phragmites australis]